MYVLKFDAKEEARKIGHSEYVSAQDFARIKPFEQQTNPLLLQHKVQRKLYIKDNRENQRTLSLIPSPSLSTGSPEDTGACARSPAGKT